MDPVRDAFQKVREEMNELHSDVFSIKQNLAETQEELTKISEILLHISKSLDKKQKKEEKTQKLQVSESEPVQNQQNPAHEPLTQTTPTHNPTHFQSYYALKGLNYPVSTGNEGVPTDRQTDQQTDKNTQNGLKILSPITPELFPKPSRENDIDQAARILDSLDGIKREIRLKFKRLTSQEMAVFSMIYQLEDETGEADYKVLASKLSLTESSVRDYVGRIIFKGIPVDKKKINNKTIKLSIPQNLKKIATLQTILQLRDL